jgi:hypothetical protein
MPERMTRRRMLGAGGVLGVAMLGAGALPTLRAAGEFPWPYKRMEPVEAAERAYEAIFQAGSCMFAAFDGVLGLLAAKFGEPYSTFPNAMMSYGGGGIAGWGTVCGALNGASAAVALFVAGQDRTAILDDLFNYYVGTELPTFRPAAPKNEVVVKLARAKSPLCHASIANSGLEMGSTELWERCARLSAEISMRTVENLNAWLEGKFVARAGMMEETAYCLRCHGLDGKGPIQIGKMDCLGCHEDHTQGYQLTYK